MSDPKHDNPQPQFVTRAYCEQRTGQILLDLGRIKDSIYGIERAGIVEGGLVGLMGEIIKNQKKTQSGLRWFAEKLLAPIVVAVIIALIIKGS